MGRPILAALLLALCCGHVLAVRLRSAQSKPPTVAGTLRLEAKEMAGKQPIFVDAFPDSKEKNLYVIFNFSPLFGKKTPLSNKEWQSWRNARWSCGWSAGSGSLELDYRTAQQGFFAISEGSILHSTLDEDQETPAAPLGREEDLMPFGKTKTEKDPVTSAREESETFRWLHHSLVMSCPLPERRSGSVADLSVAISIKGDKVSYERSGIPVADSAFVRNGTGPLLCTMLFKEANTASILQPWVQYHTARGFDQILLYVEDADSSWADKAIADIPGAEKVTVVPFWFGGISQQRAFHMQGGMLHHCLYQTRNRVEWLAVADVDEYFDVAPKDERMLGIADYLARVDSNTGAVLVRSQFWAGDASKSDLPFPCNLMCRDSGYFPAEIRSKWLGRAANLQIVNPHIVKVADNKKSVRTADPWSDVRLNHFKECSPGVKAVEGQCHQTSGCASDDSFRDHCSAALGR